MRTIGSRLRQKRMEAGLTLRQAAHAAKLSPSFVGMVERGETEIAVSRLIRLADCYGIVVADLLDNVHEREVEFTPAGSGHEIPHAHEQVVVTYLASPSWSMQPFLVQLRPKTTLEALSHPGEEFLYCVEGSPTLIVGGEEKGLSPGDTLYLPARVEHTYSNPADDVAVIVGAVRRQETGDSETIPLGHEARGGLLGTD